MLELDLWVLEETQAKTDQDNIEFLCEEVRRCLAQLVLRPQEVTEPCTIPDRLGHLSHASQLAASECDLSHPGMVHGSERGANPVDTGASPSHRAIPAAPSRHI